MFFDVKVPRLETMRHAVDMLRKAGASRVSNLRNPRKPRKKKKDMVNPVQLLATVGGSQLPARKRNNF